MRKLFYKGKAISSEDAHALPVEERIFLRGRKAKVKKTKPVTKPKGAAKK